MYIITTLNCDTTEISLAAAGDNPDEARKIFMDIINSFDGQDDKHFKYESIYVSENKFKIIKKELGYLINTKYVYKIITLQSC